MPAHRASMMRRAALTCDGRRCGWPLVQSHSFGISCEHMPIFECQNREEYLKKLEELRTANKEIRSVSLYWYEGAGKRKLLVPKGPLIPVLRDWLAVADDDIVAPIYGTLL